MTNHDNHDHKNILTNHDNHDHENTLTNHDNHDHKNTLTNHDNHDHENTLTNHDNHDHENTLTKTPRTDSLFHHCSIFKTEYPACLSMIVMTMMNVVDMLSMMIPITWALGKASRDPGHDFGCASF